MKYQIIYGLPTTQYGLVAVKRCRWCYSVINTLGLGRKIEPMGATRFGSIIWCSKDCKEEESDFLYLNRYKRQKILSFIKYHKEKKLLGRPPSQKPYTERKRKYYQEHKEKIKAQMVEIRKKNKLKQNDSKTTYRTTKETQS